MICKMDSWPSPQCQDLSKGVQVPSSAACKLPHPPSSSLALALRNSALVRILSTSLRRSSLNFSRSICSSAAAPSPSISTTPALPSFPSPDFDSFGVSRSRASNAAVAVSTAAFQSESLRWQAAMLDFRTAISYSR